MTAEDFSVTRLPQAQEIAPLSSVPHGADGTRLGKDHRKQHRKKKKKDARREMQNSSDNEEQLLLPSSADDEDDEGNHLDVLV
jgi:hypothetical protein